MCTSYTQRCIHNEIKSNEGVKPHGKLSDVERRAEYIRRRDNCATIQRQRVRMQELRDGRTPASYFRCLGGFSAGDVCLGSSSRGYTAAVAANVCPAGAVPNEQMFVLCAT